MRLVACALLALASAVPAAAQSRDSGAVAPILSLQDAITIARRNNPLYLQTRSARQRAGAALRTSYGVLLPDVSSNFSSAYREGRPQFFGGQAFGSTSDIISTDRRSTSLRRTTRTCSRRRPARKSRRRRERPDDRGRDYSASR
jgi:outer membrane protein TolC